MRHSLDRMCKCTPHEQTCTRTQHTHRHTQHINIHTQHTKPAKELLIRSNTILSLAYDQRLTCRCTRKHPHVDRKILTTIKHLHAATRLSFHVDTTHRSCHWKGNSSEPRKQRIRNNIHLFARSVHYTSTYKHTSAFVWSYSFLYASYAL